MLFGLRLMRVARQIVHYVVLCASDGTDLGARTCGEGRECCLARRSSGLVYLVRAAWPESRETGVTRVGQRTAELESGSHTVRVRTVN